MKTKKLKLKSLAVPCAFVVAALLLTGMLSTPAFAQLDDDLDRDSWNVDDGDWNDDDNWVDAGGQPSGAPALDFDRWALIANGGTATISDAAETGALSIGAGTVKIESGGSLKVAATDFTSGSTTIGRGTLDVMGSFEGVDLTSQRNLKIGPDATVKLSGDLDLTGDLELGVSATSNATLNVQGSVTLGGTISPTFSGNPAFGTSIPFITGAESVRVTSDASIALPEGVSVGRGLGIQLATTNSTASIEVDNVPILSINRVTGDAELLNVIGDAINVTGYSIFSNNGLLSKDSWSSLQSQGTAGWNEVNPRDDAIAEVSLDSVLALTNGGSAVSIGKPFVAGATHPDDEDVRFEASLDDNTFVNGIVEYVGAPNNLTLRVDPTTGAAEISHQSQFIEPFDVVAYSVLSESGALKPDAWTDLETSGAAGDSWAKANPAAEHLSELNPSKAFSFANGTEIELGSIFDTAGEQDLVFEFATADGGQKLTGSVVYESLDTFIGGGPVCTPVNGLAGDLDGNGSVAFADFLILSNNFGTDVSTYEEGDIDCNGRVEFADFLAMSNNFGTSLPGESASAVPEPTSNLLMSFAVLGLLSLRRRR